MPRQEIQQNLSIPFVFKKTWLVFACGVAYLVYAVVCNMNDAVAPRWRKSLARRSTSFKFTKPYQTDIKRIDQKYSKMRSLLFVEMPRSTC